MEMKNIRCGIGELRIAEPIGAPIRGLLLFEEIDGQQVADQILQAVIPNLS